MSDLKQLDLEKLSELTTGSTQHFKEEVEELELTVQDLRALKKAEASGKGRDDVLEFLDTQITSENVAAYLGIANEDIGELNDLLNEIDRIEDVDHFDEEKIDIEQDDLIDLVGGTVDEMKEFVEDRPLNADQLRDVLNAEERVKDRKTAKKYLEKKIKKRSVGEDVKKAREDLKELKDDLGKVQEDEGLESVGKDKEEDKEEDSGSEGDESEEEDSDEEEETDEDSAENDSKEDDESDEESEETNTEDGEEASEESEEDEDDKDSEEYEETEDESSEEDEEESDDADESEEEDENEEESEFEKKKAIAEELELDMGEDDLEAFSLKDLEKIKSEKDHREDLIDELVDEGMEEEDLRNSSTEDLEKIVASLNEKKENQEEHEEMREEAEEDLEMLMGAVRRNDDEGDEDEGKNTKEKLQDLKSSIKEKLDRSRSKDKETESGINANSVQEVLDQYRELDDEEASIKTAHIMKGYLEQTLGIKRELTYKELAENMPVDEDESIHDLAEFFVKMHNEQYTGKFSVMDSDEVIDTCEDVIDQLG
jgi:hypothetical protein